MLQTPILTLASCSMCTKWLKFAPADSMDNTSSGEHCRIEVPKQTVPHGENSDIELVIRMAETIKLPARSQITVKGNINTCSGLKG